MGAQFHNVGGLAYFHWITWTLKGNKKSFELFKVKLLFVGDG